VDRTAPSHAAPGVRFLTVLVPVRSEAEHVRSLFTALRDAVHVPCEVLLVCDADDDPTLPEARRWASILPFPLRLVRNNLGPGPARALRAGFAAARGDAVVVVMADLSDDLPLIDRMVEEMSRGADLVVGSRYVSGGRQVGGPWLQRCLARTAGLSLHGLLGFPVHDATNSFRLYRTEMLRALTIQSDWGFEISLEITVKAW
jgi:dolichol-phosphate mannosyltransferase